MHCGTALTSSSQHFQSALDKNTLFYTLLQYSERRALSKLRTQIAIDIAGILSTLALERTKNRE